MGSALVNPQERSRQNGSHFLSSLQSLSGLQPGPDEFEGLSQLQRTTGPTLEIPSGSGLALGTRPGGEICIKGCIPVGEPCVDNGPETGDLRERHREWKHRRDEEEMWEAKQEGQGSLPRAKVSPGISAGVGSPPLQLPHPPCTG